METSRNIRDTIRDSVMIKWILKLLRKKSPIKKHIKIRRVYSSDVCRIDKKGGPYEVKLYE